MSQRGAGWVFGHKPTSMFCHINGIELIARAHQLVHEGFQYKFPEKNLITVWYVLSLHPPRSCHV